MMEQLYTRKVIVALMAVILAANGWLLYQLWYEPSTVQTADTPTSESPQNPATSPDDEATEDDAEDETEEEPGATADDDGEENGSPEDEVSETPFNSQYAPPPTAPGSPGGGSEFGFADFGPGVSGQSESGFSRIQTIFTSAFSDEEDESSGGAASGGAASDESGGGGSEIGVLPVTSGFGIFPVFVVVAAAVGATVFVLRRR